MDKQSIVRRIIEKCNIYYDDAIISDELIIKKYLDYFAQQFDVENRTTAFAFHTGSLCFDIASIAALLVGCLAYGLSSNDEILNSLDIDDMVLFRGERYRWGGIELYSLSKDQPEIDYMVLRQDAKGKNGSSEFRIPYERNKHLVKPYFGTSSVTDGRGVRREKTNRSDFLAMVLGVPESDVPSTIGISFVVVADKNRFIEICKHLRIEYATGKSVELTDVVPISYYTASGEQFQIGKNQSKAEAVIKVTSKISMARDLVLDKQSNKVIGIFVTDSGSALINSSELSDLLRRKSIRFAVYAAPYSSANSSYAMDQYEDSSMFACTKDFLSESSTNVVKASKLTEELGHQLQNIVHRTMHTVHVEGGWDWASFKSIKDKLYVIKQSNWAGEERDNYVLSTIALINLFSTAFFPMRLMESAIEEGKINLAVVSPKKRLSELTDIALQTSTLKDQCLEIAQQLLDMYDMLLDCSHKGETLLSVLQENEDKKIALIVPKAYYAELFVAYYQQGDAFRNVDCMTANRFGSNAGYDIVVSVGDIIGKKFDSLECFSAPDIYVLLYDSEKKLFLHRKKQYGKNERKLNARMKGLKSDDYVRPLNNSELESEDGIEENTIREFADLDAWVDSVGLFDFKKLVSSGTATSGYSGQSEVKFVGSFTTGEQILFSKFYSAVVFNQNEGRIVETPPEKLTPGDILVFTKKDDYTKNIVDVIFEQLQKTRRLSDQVQESAVKAFYWKEVLRDYKEHNKKTYRAIANDLKKLGCSIQEVTVRQWLIEESHIVGPRNEETLSAIGELTQDPNILGDVHGLFEACREIRHYRREILSFIAQAINDKLSNKEPSPGSVFEIVYDNVENLSEMLELENVFELDDAAYINSNLVNRPILETEVIM